MGNIFGIFKKPDKIGLSGVVSYTVLINPENNKFTVLLGDIHDGVTYCDANKYNNIFIHELLDEISKNKYFLTFLEEVPRDNKIKLVELWPNAKHTQELKKLFLNNQERIIPIDPRPYLVPFSYQKYDMNILEDEERNMLMKDYLKTFDILFMLNDTPLDNSIIFFKNILDSLSHKSPQKGILKMYKLLKEKYMVLKKDININDTFEKTIKENKYFFIMLEELKMNVMDWYTVLLLMNNNNNIIHFGLAHYLNVRNVLEKRFNFKVIHKKGLETLNNEFPINSCLTIP